MKKPTNISKTFIYFLVASILIWMLITLSKEYTTEFKIPVSYSKLPQDKLMQKEPEKFISLSITGSGFKILTRKFSQKNIVLAIDKLIKKNSSQYYLIPEKRKANIQKQLKSGLIINQVLTDTIFIELGSLTSKMIPVVPDVSIKYQLGYNSSSLLKVVPDSVLVSGTDNQLENIVEILTENITLNDVATDFTKKLNLVIPEDENIKLNLSQVTISGEVDKFTEGEYEVNFSIVNVPDDVKLNTFPKTVKVIFKVGLKDFQKISKNSFSVVCDYKISEENNLNYLLPKVKAKSSMVTSVKIVPEKIEYLIIK
ncbi:hypothetical protein OD91_0702 [Lutibacter sp. Hel_I_33_5]|uniref:hypothetical protein n=1 Tax=Lutibacter sp. Hel_I_33_5 TaxID=1566289 RepID=UPI0011AA3D1E|nr:hypothetical protein [Lutibacter sp. Hel_I_33_5]TVZ55454.1 hypothetical protein OD91_0702 [Lutibacter sp. Hel_I_33_5]